MLGPNPLANATLEIGHSTIYISYAGSSDPMALIQGYLRNGYNNGYWNGWPSDLTGAITSIPAAQNTARTTAIGYADAADGSGTDTVPNTVELKYTVLGDANLDGTVYLADFLALTRHFGQRPSWDAGDFNYDGTANLTDLLSLVRHFGQSPPPTLSASNVLLPSSSDDPRLARRRA